MIGERLRRARKAAALSLRALAERTGVSHTTLSKFERGKQIPNSRQLVELSHALGVRSEYLLRPTRVELGEVAYRAHSRLSAALRDRIHADVLDQLERWQELLALFPGEVLPHFDLPRKLPASIEDEEAIEAVAETLRAAWQLGGEPVPDLIDALESRGVLVVQTDAEGKGRFNGLSATVGEGLARPLIVVHAEWPGDRQRFTLAHELGHLVLAGRLERSLEIEKACNRFAGAFLLPRAAVRQALGERRQMLEPQELYLLKLEYGLSMQACLFRALQADVISASTQRELFRLFNARGWRTQEPGHPYPRERTVRFRQLVYHALAEDFISESKAAELLGIPVARLHRERRLEGTDADPRR